VVDLSGWVLSARIDRFECNSLLLITRNQELGPPLCAIAFVTGEDLHVFSMSNDSNETNLVGRR
jgi:hypothetical protein